MTEPLEHITFPYRTQQTVVGALSSIIVDETATFSINAFVIPIALMGYTALSVLRHTTRFTLCSIAEEITL